MKTRCSVLLVASSVIAFPSFGALVISEFLANPTSTDSPKEWVELVATAAIDFAATPYSVIWANNGTATADGWIEGLAITYGFSITSGTVAAGGIVYVGGTAPEGITGTFVRQINTGTTAGDGFGTAAASGVLGNGGANADAIAVFSTAIGNVTASTVPVDAIFFGTGTGSAVVSGGADGYQLPVNDRYAGGKLQAGSFLAPDPVSAQSTTATGTYDESSGTWTTLRSWAVGGISDNSTSLTVVPEPASSGFVAAAMLGLFIGFRHYRARKKRAATS